MLVCMEVNFWVKQGCLAMEQVPCAPLENVSSPPPPPPGHAPNKSLYKNLVFLPSFRLEEGQTLLNIERKSSDESNEAEWVCQSDNFWFPMINV